MGTNEKLALFLTARGLHVAMTGEGPLADETAARLETLGAAVTRLGVGAVAVPPGISLVVAASTDPAADASLLGAARTAGLLTASANGAPASASLGAVRSHGAVSVAATTSGACPEYDEKLASDAAGTLTDAHARFAAVCGSLRAKLTARFPDPDRRAAIWRQILDSPVFPMLQAGLDDEAQELAERMAWGTG